MIVMMLVMIVMMFKCSNKDQVLQFGKEEREKQNGLKAKVYLIESHTIKRGDLDANTVAKCH